MAAAWYVPSQSTLRARELLSKAENERWIAPHCFAYEVPNLLLREERKGQLVRGAAEIILQRLKATINVRVLDAPADDVLEGCLSFARERRISLFDALYARCAAETGAILASRDGGLLSAAGVMGCQVYDARDPHDR